jgi:AraC family transcriptional regulator
VFRQVTGIPPCQFFYAMRLSKAKELLLTTRLKVIDICYDVGYQSLGTFTRRFTELVGVSPSRFRSQARCRKEHPILIPQTTMKASASGNGPSLAGTVSGPELFRGVIFIGLFGEPIPQGKPAACTVIWSGGSFCIGDLSEGTFYLFALALPAPVEASNLFHAPTALRAGGQSITVSNGTVRGTGALELRPPELFDPPILVAIPAVLSAKLRGEFLEGASSGDLAPYHGQSQPAWIANP